MCILYATNIPYCKKSVSLFFLVAHNQLASQEADLWFHVLLKLKTSVIYIWIINKPRVSSIE